MAFYRRNLPHWHPKDAPIFITWRLSGSLPVSLQKKSGTARNGGATNTSDLDREDAPGEQFLQLDAALDSGKTRPLWLGNPEIAVYAEEPIVRGAELGRGKGWRSCYKPMIASHGKAVRYLRSCKVSNL